MPHKNSCLVFKMLFAFIFFAFLSINIPIGLTQSQIHKFGLQEKNSPESYYIFNDRPSEITNSLKGAASDKDVNKKLDKLRAYINEVMKDSKVPGLAMGIVKDGTIILAEGFGYRDLEQKLPVTSKTLFAIGSCSKAFTTMAIGILVDEGKVEWDKPVRNYLPAFELKDEYITANMTVRDLVTHRSGLPRHDLLWYGSSLTRKEIFDRLRYLDFSAGFREKFQYNNLMFMTAGYLVGQVTNNSWENFVAERIFKPLDMTNSNFSVEASQKATDFAQPYSIENEKVKKIPFRNLDEIGPAGSINSCVDDMLKWLQFHLNKGKVGDKQLVSESEMQNMQTPYMFISSRMESNDRSHSNYGLGWFISMYRGHKFVQHDGGIDGFVTSTTFLPFDNLGVFVVNNAASSISSYVTSYAVDLLLGFEPIDRYAKNKEDRKKAEDQQKEQKDEPIKGTHPSHPLKDYAGEYEHPAYGVFALTNSGDSLAGQFNSFDFKLEHFHYDVFKTKDNEDYGSRKVSFLSNKKGDINKLSASLEPAVDDIVFTKKPSQALTGADYLKQFIGSYKIGEMIIKVELKGNNVLIAIPTGQPTIELEPYKENEFNFKGISGYSTKFTVEHGKAVEMILNQPNGVFTAKRVN